MHAAIVKAVEARASEVDPEAASSRRRSRRKGSAADERPLRLRPERRSLADGRGALPARRALVVTRRARPELNPAEHVHPEVVEAMRELGVDLSGRVPHRLERADAEWADLVVTMGCGDACPVIPGKRYIDWELEDPAGKPIGRGSRDPRRDRRPHRAAARGARQAEGEK